MTSQEPNLDAAVSYFVNMAKGNSLQSKRNGQNGLGIARQPSLRHVIPEVKLVTPTAQAVKQATETLKVIRRPAQKRKRATSYLDSKKTKYLAPALD